MKHLSILLLVSATAIGLVAGEGCCGFPGGPNRGDIVNPLDFRCNETLIFQCINVSELDNKAVGLYGMEDANTETEDNIIIQNPSLIRTSVVCNRETQKWHLLFNATEFPAFECVYQRKDGTWIYG